MVPGGGQNYQRWSQGFVEADDDDTPSNIVQIVRGGCVMFEPGNIGGTFVGVMFIGDEGTPYEVQDSIAMTLSQQALRIYGGHVFIAGGRLRFINCAFFDFELVIPLMDRLRIGGDVLILAGYATFTNCIWSCTTFFGIDTGVGLDIAIFGGVSIFTFCHIQINNLCAVTATVGQTTFIAGGVSVFTGVSVAFFSGIEMFDGAGALTVLAGAMIMTGVAIEDNYAMVAGFGVGFDICLLAGLMITTGRACTQFLGALDGALLGGFTYVGTGLYVAIGSTAESYSPLGSEQGGGGSIWNGGGLSVYIAHPIVVYNGVWTSFLVGGLVGLPAGLLVWIGCPIVLSSAVEYYAGIGGAVFVGAGVAVMGYSPTFIHSAIINRIRDFWIMGSCEPKENIWAKGPVQLYAKGITTNCTYARDVPEEEWRRRQLAVQQQQQEEEEGEPSSVEEAVATIMSMRERTAFLAYHMPILTPNRSRSESTRPVVQTLRSFLPPALYDKVEAMDTQLQAIEAALPLGLGKPQRPPAFHIASPMDGYCGACDVDNLEGPGLTSCQHADSCEPEHFTPPPGQAGLLGGIDFENFDYPQHFMVLANLDVVEAGGGGGGSRRGLADGPSVNATMLEKALMAALGQDTGDPLDDAVGPEALYVTVWSAEPEELFTVMTPGLAESVRGAYYATLQEENGWRRRMQERTGGESNVQRFKALLVSPSRSKAQAVVASLRATPSADEARYLQQEERQDGDPSTIPNGSNSSTIDLAAAVRDYLDVEDVGAWYEQLLFIPAYNSDLFRKDATPLTGVGKYSILLADPAQSSAPLHHLQYKAVTYDVLLEEFPPRSVVQVYAVRAAAPDDDAAAAARPPQLLATVTTDGEGQARLRQRFWPLVLPAGDYMFKAVDVASGAEGLSPLYSLSAAPQRRKLYGPVMWL